MKTFLAGLAVVAVSSLVGAWLFMVVVGIVHAEWLTQLPTVGYGSAFVVALAIDLMLAARVVFTTIVNALVGDKS